MGFRPIEEPVESFLSQAVLQLAVASPEPGVQFQCQGDIGYVLFVHIAAKTPCFGPTADADGILIVEVDVLQQAVQRAEQVRLAECRGRGDALLVLE